MKSHARFQVLPGQDWERRQAQGLCVEEVQSMAEEGSSSRQVTEACKVDESSESEEV